MPEMASSSGVAERYCTWNARPIAASTAAIVLSCTSSRSDLALPCSRTDPGPDSVMAAPFACGAAHAINRADNVSFAAKMEMPEGNPSFANGLPAGCSAVELGSFTTIPHTTTSGMLANVRRRKPCAAH